MAGDGSTIVTFRWDEMSKKYLLEAWDTGTGKVTVIVATKESILIKELENLRLELSNDGKQLAFMLGERPIELSDLTTRKKSRTLEIPPEVLKKYASGFEGKRCVAFSPDGKQLAVSLGSRAIAVYSLNR
jgi:WD40 repeat protein